jgi:hypothetical protein
MAECSRRPSTGDQTTAAAADVESVLGVDKRRLLQTCSSSSSSSSISKVGKRVEEEEEEEIPPPEYRAEIHKIEIEIEMLILLPDKLIYKRCI